MVKINIIFLLLLFSSWFYLNVFKIPVFIKIVSKQNIEIIFLIYSCIYTILDNFGNFGLIVYCLLELLFEMLIFLNSLFFLFWFLLSILSFAFSSLWPVFILILFVFGFLHKFLYSITIKIMSLFLFNRATFKPLLLGFICRLDVQ